MCTAFTVTHEEDSPGELLAATNEEGSSSELFTAEHGDDSSGRGRRPMLIRRALFCLALISAFRDSLSTFPRAASAYFRDLPWAVPVEEYFTAS